MILLMLQMVWLAACTEQELNRVVDANDVVDQVPDIGVEPDYLSFSAAAPGSISTQEIVVTNHGVVDLNVANVVVSGTTAFTLGSTGLVAVLAPGESVKLPVSFTPANPEDAASLTIYSDDPDSPSLAVPLDGEGLLPQLFVSPNPYSFGDVLVDCRQEQPITLSNLGNATLTVSQVVPVGTGFDLPEIETPFFIEPGENISLALGFTPTTDVSYAGDIWISSDSLVESTVATISGAGTYDPNVIDEFWQGDGPWERADIYFYVDQSGSMRDDIANMTANFQGFIDMLGGLDLDWQVVIATSDSGCNATGILTPETANVDQLFLDGADGYAGRYTESGLALAANGMKNTVPGECNEGFIRENSKTTLVLVSDEPDQSNGIWSNYVNEIQFYAPNAAITAIVGDVPGGCATADPGTGYYEAAAATQGAFLSICESDWSGYFRAIATLASTGATDRFVLSSAPDPATITTRVDGDLVTTGWTYDEPGNAVVFDADHLPGSGAHILVDYTILGDCIE